jgi:hypothetical protein
MRQHVESWDELPGSADNAASVVRTRRNFVVRKNRNQTAIYTRIVRTLNIGRPAIREPRGAVHRTDLIFSRISGTETKRGFIRDLSFSKPVLH